MFWISITRAPSVQQSRCSPEDWAALACWAGRFTPRITRQPDALGLEVSGSLRLFGGRDSLVSAVRSGLADFAQDGAASFHAAFAATPRAALWLSLARHEGVCAGLAETRQALQGVPLAVLPLSKEVRGRLAGFGLRRMGDVMALPRSELGLRLGEDFVLDLARALGEIDDPQVWFVFPDVFEQTLELPAPVDVASILIFSARRLLGMLCGWLSARNAATREIELAIAHGDGQVTPLRLSFSVSVHESGRIERVLRERLSQCALTAPATALHLAVRHTELRDARSHALFGGGDAEHGENALADLLDRLRARMGTDAVQSWACHADHRPEQATRPLQQGLGWSKRNKGKKANATKTRPTRNQRVGVGETALASGQTALASLTSATSAVTAAAGRGLPEGLSELCAWPQPLWLLSSPQPLMERNGRPCGPHDSKPLQLVAGPERIEAGWWDGGDVRRDYFIALDAGARWCWIFRRQDNSAGWFIHGWFS